MSKPRVRSMEGAQLLLNQLSRELSARPPTDAAYVVHGKAHTWSDLATQVAAEAAVYEAVARAKRELAAALLVQRARVDKTRALLAKVRTCLEINFGADSPELEAFGLAPRRKRRALTVEEKLLKAARARRTRELRGTLGPRQKKAIKATGPISIVFPAVTPTPPAERPAA